MGTETPNPDQPRYQTITEADKRAFDAAKAKIKTPGTFPKDHKALRYMLIPPKLLEVVPDPDALDVVNLNENPQDGIFAFVVSKTPLPHIIDDKEPSPPDTEFATMKSELINRGKLKIDGVVLLSLYLGAQPGEQLHVFDFGDLPELRGLGIATSLYERLHDTAQQLGFRFITGVTSTEKSLAFFKNRTGFSLDEIIPDQQGFFRHLAEDPDVDRGFIIDFLNPQDIPNFVQPSVLEQRARNQQP